MRPSTPNTQDLTILEQSVFCERIRSHVNQAGPISVTGLLRLLLLSHIVL